MPSLSIIIPVYNVEDYLECCIESVLEQTFRDFEIILVDDGSTDNCGHICDRYSDKYDFITVIHKENGGLSDARNVGITHAQGDYVLFIDSDDYIEIDALTAIAGTLGEDPDVDVIFLDVVKVFPDGSTIPLGDGYRKESICRKTQNEVMEHIAMLPKFPGSACSKLVRRSTIDNHSLYFEKGLLSEDIDWTIRLLLAAKKFNYCEYDYYYYRQQREGSITNRITSENVESLLRIIKKWGRSAKQEPISEFQEQINAFMAYELAVLLGLCGCLKSEDRRALLSEAKQYTWLFSYGKNMRVRVIRSLNSVVGTRMTSAILGSYLEYRSFLTKMRFAKAKQKVIAL